MNEKKHEKTQNLLSVATLNPIEKVIKIH